uniref:Uncharacterized protein n=1 Tax=Oryza punctata TaxID=4537 RepID=A0A0E0JQS2_ORYPU
MDNDSSCGLQDCGSSCTRYRALTVGYRAVLITEARLAPSVSSAIKPGGAVHVYNRSSLHQCISVSSAISERGVL